MGSVYLSMILAFLQLLNSGPFASYKKKFNKVGKKEVFKSIKNVPQYSYTLM